MKWCHESNPITTLTYHETYATELAGWHIGTVYTTKVAKGKSDGDSQGESADSANRISEEAPPEGGWMDLIVAQNMCFIVQSTKSLKNIGCTWYLWNVFAWWLCRHWCGTSVDVVEGDLESDRRCTGGKAGQRNRRYFRRRLEIFSLKKSN